MTQLFQRERGNTVLQRCSEWEKMSKMLLNHHIISLTYINISQQDKIQFHDQFETETETQEARYPSRSLRRPVSLTNNLEIDLLLGHCWIL